MKGILFFVTLSFSSIVSAHTYYVQDKAYNENASDINLGTDINYPWATWQRAFNAAAAGDTVYFRGGSWYPKTDHYGNVTEHDPLNGFGHNGTYSNPICFFAYPPDVAKGNMPVLDCRNTHPSTTGHVGLKIDDARYIEFKGLEITNVYSHPRESGEMWVAGIMAQDSHHLTFERMTSSHTGGNGFFLQGHDTLYLINCDTHHNADSLDLSMPGGDGDGFNVSDDGPEADSFKIAYIYGCRAWNCSDDGFNVVCKNQMEVHDCWSWNNGDLEGDASGFKFRYSQIKMASKRQVYNCITAYNDRAGFTDLNLNYTIGPFMEYFNNTSFKDGQGFGSGKGKVFECDIHPAEVYYRNNISYASTGDYPAGFRACDYQYPTYVIQDHNTWVQTGSYFHTEANPDYRVRDDDFMSLDTAQLRWPRQVDGSLPDITFLRLNAGSDLIDGGVDVGLAFHGPAPDLGVFEYAGFTVDLFSPERESRFTIGDKIILKARVEATDTEISEVNFYTKNKEILLGSGEQTSPSVWEFTWESNEVGFFEIRAAAFNSEGVSATSSLVGIYIYPVVGPEENGVCTIVPNPHNGTFVLELMEPLQTTSNIHIISMDGRLVAIDTMYENEFVKAFDLSHLGAGYYSIVFDNTNASQPCGTTNMIKL